MRFSRTNLRYGCPVAFIRRVRTGSGATAVQLAQYVTGGGQRILTHVGSARTQAELGVLLERARRLLADPAQGTLELPDVPRAQFAAAMAPPPAQPTLVEQANTPKRLRRATAPQVEATCCGLLFDVVAGVYADLGFDVVGDEVFRDLVVARIVEPTSLLDVERVLVDLGRQPASLSTRKRALAKCVDGAYRDQIAGKCFAHAAASGDASLVLYDVTTLHFEAEKEDDLRKVGYSKDRKVDPQIVVGLLVDRHGFPLEIGCFEGNKAETTTIMPIIGQYQQRHQIESMVVVADAGMLSAKNLAALEEARLLFIVGSRMTKGPHDLAPHFRWHGDALEDGQVIDTITPKRGPESKENDPNLKAEPVWDAEEHPGSWRAIWTYSAKRCAHDLRTLEKQVERAQAVVAGEKKAKGVRFVATDGSTRRVDDAAIERARSMAGLKGYVTNIPASEMGADEVIAKYHDLWNVERSFRMSKGDLAARPLFARRRDAIEAHLTIVFTALAVAREIQNRSGLAIRNVLRQLRPLRSATISINAAVETFPPAIDSARQRLVDAIKTPSHHAGVYPETRTGC